MRVTSISTRPLWGAARSSRSGRASSAGSARGLEAVLVDDLSRLARNTLLLLSVLEEFRFHGVRVVSVADGLDTDDQEATFGIQVRGVFNELQLLDLKKKTFRGQLGQKQRGSSRERRRLDISRYRWGRCDSTRRDGPDPMATR